MVLDPIRVVVRHPASFRGTLRQFFGFDYRNYDSSAYWRSRASGTGQSRVLWTNEDYNRLYRQRQLQILRRYTTGLPTDARVLDIGCGIGVVAQMLVQCHATLVVDGVDFREMIDVAASENPSPRIHYIASDAEGYAHSIDSYDLVLSSGCFSAIRRIEALEQAIANAARATKPGGVMLMIDPFHRWVFLARAKYGSRDVTNLMRTLGFREIERTGVLFWPYRLRLASSDLEGAYLARLFNQGEHLLHLLGSHYWADYKVLAFRKNA